MLIDTTSTKVEIQMTTSEALVLIQKLAALVSKNQQHFDCVVSDAFHSYVKRQSQTGTADFAGSLILSVSK
jgi:hypothetical protein